MQDVIVNGSSIENSAYLCKKIHIFLMDFLHFNHIYPECSIIYPYKETEFMKYLGLPWGMWSVFNRSFTKKLKNLLSMDSAKARGIRKSAKRKYREIIKKLPVFEKDDIFLLYLTNCSLLASFISAMKKEERPSLEKISRYYQEAMMIAPMKVYCKAIGLQRFSKSDIASQKKTALLKAGQRNPYSWNLDFYSYQDHSGYENRVSYCGIAVLMKELNLEEYIPAVCHLEYAMAQAGGYGFENHQTILQGSPYCDCCYKKN